MTQQDETPRRANRAARLARALTRRSQSGDGGLAAAVFVVVLLAWLGLTGYGTWLASRATGSSSALADAFYGPLTFLTPQEGYRTAERMGNDWLRIGRFFGVALPVLTLLWAGLYLCRLRIARWLIARIAEGHIVVLGRGGAADALARASSQAGVPVALLDTDMTPERAADLARAGVVILPEASSTASWLARARARHAAHIAAWSAEDSISIADALAAAAALHGSRREIVVQVDTPETQRALRHAPALLENDDVRLRPLSPSLAAIRRAIGGAALVEEAAALGANRVAVQLHGDSIALQLAATSVLRHNWSIFLKPPELLVAEDSAAWVQWRRHQASFLAHATAVFDEAQPHFGISSDDADARVTRHIVDLGDDDRTLARAFDLASHLAQRRTLAPRVQPVLRSAHAARALIAQADALHFAEPILLDQGRPLDTLLAREEDQVAAALHLDYVARFGGSGGAAETGWRSLAETYVHASRAAADHRSVKRYDLARARAIGIDDMAIVERMTRVEHLRWSAERLLDGWAPGPRDNGRRLHNNLAPWDALSQIDRDKDREQVMLAIGDAGGAAS